MTVEVFKTDLQHPAEVIEMTIKILERLSGYRITFDLEDCDKIMRIETKHAVVDVGAVVGIGNLCCKNIAVLE